MVDVPEPRYARTPDGVYLAYQVIGSGPVDLLLEGDWFAGLDLMWQNEAIAAVFADLASFTRLIIYDPRGLGLSSRNVPPPNLETRADDLKVVLDAAGSESTVLYSQLAGGASIALLASTEPERVRALVWWNPSPRAVWTPDYPWGVGPEYVRRSMAAIRECWGTERYGQEAVDLWSSDPGAVQPSPADLAKLARWVPWIARVTRGMATPDVAEALESIWYQTDVRGVLPSLRVPTLLLGPVGSNEDLLAYVASLVPGAAVRRIPVDHLEIWGDSHRLVHEAIREFVGIERPVANDDTILATVLFTDIVGATERQTSMGDHAWKSLVERHHGAVRTALGRWRGSEVDTAGDGFYATFDGPARAVRCALEIGQHVRELGIEVRAGLHTGECELIDGKVGGLAVSIGARIAALAGPSEVLVSQTVKDLVAGSGLLFEDRGEQELKGAPDHWRLYRVTG